MIEVEKRVAMIRPLLAGLDPWIQGAVLAELLSIWIGGHHAGSVKETRKLRQEILKMHIEYVQRLVDLLYENGHFPPGASGRPDSND